MSDSNIAENEPSQITIGFSVAWVKRGCRWSASGNTLNYAFVPVGGGTSLIFSSTEGTGNSFTMRLSPSDTAQFTAGQYAFTGYITDDLTGGNTLKEVISTGITKALPNPTTNPTGSQLDFYAEMVALLRKALKELAGGVLVSTSVNGKTYTRRSLAEVRQELNRYDELLRAEQQAAKLGACGENPNNIYVRFR